MVGYDTYQYRIVQFSENLFQVQVKHTRYIDYKKPLIAYSTNWGKLQDYTSIEAAEARVQSDLKYGPLGTVIKTFDECGLPIKGTSL